ncbi:isopentenyl-diphosphate Delta-isomerase 1 [Phymastichus coffea]|uniref:isopentenyl-diphosphate Delta-isomerase 1 n=1 Tax=Phymastichus coffea TaxID=108790 RepID=UPI00273BD862|nr:isopentenyl-diphosphate Delta-isomerase 1 [Phymastichus coffea]XP_058801952.1 isopentenyl-diphosphate Delta-isomerase 1 [Phymastichus coffea]XP_058801953.1 isopentenyl-diphosphate Delta-isomerase 1 [Phymastichus coffea]XP_058801954.1 isopentenyl-diphosphate Delta-isomerase 1 [Phymastichus coffea]
MLGISRRLCSTLKDQLLSVRSHYANMQIALQQKIALEEKCILVDEFDRPVGEATKKYCHEIAKDGSIPLHRAFSVFIFNKKGDLLVQRRAASKLTFPGCYTNTCCSHPLADIQGESEEKDALGIRKAAQRRLGFELGIPSKEVLPENFNFITRIHYQAAGDEILGEHEIDYVLFLQVNKVTVDPNPDEVSEIRWVPRSTINNFVKNIDAPLTPWFKLMLDHQLLVWWDNLDSIHKFQDHSTIHRFLKT